MGYNEDI